MDGLADGHAAQSERAAEHAGVERQLRESERRLALAQRAGRVGVYDWDVVNNKLFATPEAEDIYGMPVGVAQYKFEDFIGLVHPEDRARVREEIYAHIAARQPEVEQHFRILRPDGGVRHIEQRAMINYDEAGRALRIVGTSLDVTRRLLTEETLRKSEEKFSRVFQLSPDAINLNRMSDGVYVEINEGFTRMTGWTRAEVIGRSSLPGDLGIWVQAGDRERLVAGLSAKGQVEGLEADFRRKDGSILRGLMSARIMEVNGESCALTITRDITQRKDMEAKLGQRNAVLHAVINSTEDPIFSVDGAYRYTLFNAPHARFMKAVFGRDIELGANKLDYIPDPPRRQTSQRNIDRALAGERVDFEFYVGDDPRDRRVCWLSYNPVRAANGEVTGVAVFGKDLTHQRRLQEQLLQAQKMEAIGLLAGGIAHDFRNQLTIISGFCELLRESRDVLPGGRFLLDEILKAARQSTEMTSQLLGFSRKQLLEPKLVDLAELAAETCRMLPPLLREDVKVVFSAAPGPHRALLDPVQLQQAIFNLATNARDAMPQGGELRIGCQGIVPDAAFRRRHPEAAAVRYVALVVSDTGHGMDETTQAHIFEPFYTTKPNGLGTGLGLAMVYGFVQQCGGIIDVQSSPGAGSTFSLYFREAGGETGGAAAETAAPVSQAGEPAGRERILVVEDEASVRHLIVRFLASAGYVAVEAGDAMKALELLGDPAQAWGMLITDMVMPGLSGTELAQRARKLRPRLPVLLVSGYTNAQLLERGLKELDCYYLGKPFDRHELCRAVRQVLDGRAPA